MNSVTLRQREVLQLLAQGLSSKEIADRMCLSFHTVETHRKKLRVKFAAKNSAELLMKVMQLPSMQNT